LLVVDDLSKQFGSLKACDKIALDILSGEIHALLGENGAGKSTLVKMLYGVLDPGDGAIFWQGRPVSIENPKAARELGIGMVFQHFSLFESLTVAENIALALDHAGSLDEVATSARDLSRSYGLPLDPDMHIADLSVGERQRVEIVRTLLQDPKLIILDEPTSVLTPQESEGLFETLEKLRSEGRAILYISHRLEEVRRICDRATVLRNGRVTGTCDPRAETAVSLARMMVGSDVKPVSAAAIHGGGEIRIELDALSLPARSPFAVSLKDVSLVVHAGDILGIAGVAGNGQNELFDVLSGEVRARVPQSVRLFGHNVGRTGISGRRLIGAAFVPEERNGHGAVGDLHLSQNLVLSRHRSDSKALLAWGPIKRIRGPVAKAMSRAVMEAMDVRAPNDDPLANALSGGNLQKFIVGRELDRQPQVLVVNQPTWGVDAGAASRIRQALIDLAAQGSAVIVISQDLDEIFEIASRVAVLSHGRLSRDEAIADMTRERIGLMMGGLFDAPGAHHAGEGLSDAH